MSFPLVPRMLRSQKSVKATNLNVSYDIVVHKDDGKIVEAEKISTDEIIRDLRCKLASSHALNNQYRLELDQSKLENKVQHEKLLNLDGKLNYLLAKTQMTDFGTQTDHINLCNNNSQTYDIEILTSHPKLDNSCQTEKVEAVEAALLVKSQPLEVTRECSTQVCSSVVIDNVVNQKRKYLPLAKSKKMVKKVNSSVSGISRKVSKNRKSSLTISVAMVKPKVQFITDEIGRDMGSAIKNSLPDNYEVASTVCSNATLAHVAEKVDKLSQNVNRYDHVILLLGSRHVIGNSGQYVKRKYNYLISKCNETNLLDLYLRWKY